MDSDRRRVRSIGGRYSALSNFGTVPAAIMGIDVKAFLVRTKLMADACSSFVPASHNPGASLGIALGVLANYGRDKLTFVLSPNLRALGAWLEQLIAESTGKHGKGIVPIDGETLGPPSTYGEDRVFAYVHDGDEEAAQLSGVQLLEDAGHPLIRITLANIDTLGREFFRWEVATAVAGAAIGINPFDQPDVEASKENARRLTEANGGIGEVGPISAAYGMRVFADPGLTVGSVQDVLAAHLLRLHAGDYFAINAYLEMSEDNQRELEAIRQLVRDTKHVATTLGFGPRFLHSTGQLHKGGPNGGVFLEIIVENADNLHVPGERHGFSELKTAQAVGDYEALLERKRRVVRVDLSHANSLATLRTIIERSL